MTGRSIKGEKETRMTGDDAKRKDYRTGCKWKSRKWMKGKGLVRRRLGRRKAGRRGFKGLWGWSTLRETRADKLQTHKGLDRDSDRRLKKHDKNKHSYI